MLRVALPLMLLTMVQVTPLSLVGSSEAKDAAPTGNAKMVRATWQSPDKAHVIVGTGTITRLERPTLAITNLPPDEDLKTDLTMRVVVELDTSTGTRAPINLKQRSGMLTMTPLPEDLKDDIIQPSAIDGTTAKVRIDITADQVRLRFLKSVYYEQVKITLPAQNKKQQSMDWTWKPFGKHRD